MTCALCGATNTVDAHVRDRADFGDNEDDRMWNIIPLCPTCHDVFDEKPGRVGICQGKDTFLRWDESGTLEVVPTRTDVRYVRDEYVQWKNERCILPIRQALGMIPGYKAGSMC